MHDYFLRAPDEAAINAALLSANLIDENGNPTSELVCIDRTGEIGRVTGYVDDEPVIEVIESYHANVRLMFEPTAGQIEALYPVTILAPDQPVRVWAGG